MPRKHRGKHEGTLYQRENGSWRAQICHMGERLSKDFRDETDARLWLRDVRSDIDHGRTIGGGSIILCNFLDNWLAQHRFSLREKTSHQYGSIISKHITPFLGGLALQELSLLGVENYYSLLQERGVGIRTIQIIHNILHASLEKAVRYGMIGSSPTQGATLPVYRFDEMQVLSKEQVRRFLASASHSSSYAFFHLALVTGMRMGELLGLKWSDIDWYSGTITIQRQKQYVPGVGWNLVEPKTRFGRRTIKVGEATLQNLRSHKRIVDNQKRNAGQRWTDIDLVFPNSVGKPRDASNIRLEFNQVLDQAGIPRIRFHDLRHTAASILLNHKIPVIVVSRILGHSRPSVTLDLYGHVLGDMQDEAAQVMENALNPCI